MADTTSTPLDALYTFNQNVGTFSSGATNPETGEFIEDTTVLKGLVEAVFKDAFGMDTPDPATPMGRLVEWLAINFANAMRVNVQNANQLVLSAAAGQQLDAIALWFGLYRKPAVPTTVVATLRGNERNLVIPAGSRARTEEGAIFVLTEDATLSSPSPAPYEGMYEISAVFHSSETGAIGCPAHSLTTIDTPIMGWATITNEEDGVVGRDSETDESLRARIEASRFHGNGFIYSMKNAIEAIDGVNSSMVVENNTGEVKTVHGVDEMPPHSICVCVDCAQSAESAVAKAIFDTKPCGTAYKTIQGVQPAKSITVLDAYGNPYDVYFFNPSNCEIRMDLVVKNRSYGGTNLSSDVKAAILAFAREHGYKIGEAVYAADIIRAVEAAIPGIIVVSCGVSDAGTQQSQTLSFQEVPAYKKAYFEDSNITVREM